MTFLLSDPDDAWDEAFIAAAFVSWHTEPSEDDSYIPMTEQEAQETFDSWLNEERAKAFDEGASAFGDSFWDGDAGVVVNPYRKADS